MTELETWVGPKPITLTPPNYPPFAAADRREGWVAMSFLVSKEGKVTDAMIEDSTGSEEFERSALATIQKWTYAPATRNGEPVEHPMTRMVMRFEMAQGKPGATPQFARQVKELSNALAASDVPKADQLLAELGDQERHTLYEDAWYWYLRYSVLRAKQTPDAEELITSLSRAVGGDREYLTPDAFLIAVSQLFALRVQDNDFGGALQAFERLKSSTTAKQAKDYERVMGVLDENVQRMRAAVAGPATLLANGHVGAHDYWVHPLVRRSFALSDIQGELQELEVRCKRQSVSYTPVTDQHTWTVPASWEACAVYLKGTPGAAFKFYEYPDHG